MRTPLQILSALSAAAISVQVCAAPSIAALSTVSQSIPPLRDRMMHIPDSDYRTWFSTMLLMEYTKGPDWQPFFGDVGPTEGCRAIEQIKDSIVDRDLAAFKAAYISKVSTGMAPSVFSNIPDGYLAMPFNSRISRFERSLEDFLRPRVIEMGNAALRWSDSHGYRGRRLGYNAAGAPYWGSQSAMTTLVCISPNDEGLLRGWKD